MGTLSITSDLQNKSHKNLKYNIKEVNDEQKKDEQVLLDSLLRKPLIND